MSKELPLSLKAPKPIGRTLNPPVMGSAPKRRTIDRSKPKVRLDGTPDPNCIPCQQKKNR